MNKLMRIKFNFKNGNGTNIFGELYLPIIDNKIYKAARVLLTSGYLDTKYRENTGKEAKSDREYKDSLIEKLLPTNDPEIFKVKTPIEMMLPNGVIGVVKLTSLLSGYHTNKNVNIFICEPFDSEIDGYPLGKVFQRLQKSPITDLSSLPIITFEEFSKNSPEYIKELVYRVNDNISVTEIEAKNE